MRGSEFRNYGDRGNRPASSSRSMRLSDAVMLNIRSPLRSATSSTVRMRSAKLTSANSHTCNPSCTLTSRFRTRASVVAPHQTTAIACKANAKTIAVGNTLLTCMFGSTTVTVYTRDLTPPRTAARLATVQNAEVNGLSSQTVNTRLRSRASKSNVSSLTPAFRRKLEISNPDALST